MMHWWQYAVVILMVISTSAVVTAAIGLVRGSSPWDAVALAGTMGIAIAMFIAWIGEKLWRK